MNEGLVAILIVGGTIAGVLLGVRIQARKDALGELIAPAGGPGLWVPSTLLALSVAFVGVLMWIGIQLLGQRMDREHLFVRRPVSDVRITQSVDGNALGGWKRLRGFAGLQVDPAPGSSRGKDGALRVAVDLKGGYDAALVLIPGEKLPDSVAVATAWVYVENSEAARTAGLHARLVGRMNGGNNGSFSLAGNRTPLMPGVWTEVVWTGSYYLELSPALGGDSAIEKTVRASERLTYLGVRLEADKPFQGSVFVDDLRMYPAQASSAGRGR